MLENAVKFEQFFSLKRLEGWKCQKIVKNLRNISQCADGESDKIFFKGQN